MTAWRYTETDVHHPLKLTTTRIDADSTATVELPELFGLQDNIEILKNCQQENGKRKLILSLS